MIYKIVECFRFLRFYIPLSASNSIHLKFWKLLKEQDTLGIHYSDTFYLTFRSTEKFGCQNMKNIISQILYHYVINLHDQKKNNNNLTSYSLKTNTRLFSIKRVEHLRLMSVRGTDDCWEKMQFERFPEICCFLMSSVEQLDFNWSHCFVDVFFYMCTSLCIHSTNQRLVWL